MLTPYAGAAGILLLMNGKLTFRKLCHNVCCRALILIFLSCRIQGKKRNYLLVSVVSFTLSSIEYTRC